MPVVLARIDDRLVHGQVVEGWVPHVGAEVLVVVSEAVCLDPARCRLMRLILPESLELRVVPPVGLVEMLRSANKSRMLVLFEDFESVLAAWEAGLALERVNLGNLHHLRGGMEVTPSVFLNRKDLDAVRRLAEHGVAVEAREVPDGRSVDLVEFLGPAADDGR